MEWRGGESRGRKKGLGGEWGRVVGGQRLALLPAASVGESLFIFVFHTVGRLAEGEKGEKGQNGGEIEESKGG